MDACSVQIGKSGWKRDFQLPGRSLDKTVGGRKGSFQGRFGTPFSKLIVTRLAIGGAGGKKK